MLHLHITRKKKLKLRFKTYRNPNPWQCVSIGDKTSYPFDTIVVNFLVFFDFPVFSIQFQSKKTIIIELLGMIVH